MNNKKQIIFLINKFRSKLVLVRKNRFNSILNNNKYLKIVKTNLNSNYQFIKEKTNKNVTKISNFIDKFFDNENDDDSLMPPPQIWSRVLIWTLGAGSLFLITWSFVFKVEETIILQGEISTKSPEVKLAAIDAGNIIEVFVEPFDFVNKGEKILVYSDDETPKRLKSFLVRRDIILSDIKATKISYKIDQETMINQIKLNEGLLNKYFSLVSDGAISKQDVIDKEFQLSQAKLELKSNNQDFLITLNNLKKNLEEIDIGITEAQIKLNRFVVRSTLDGFIQNLPYQNTGELIQPGEIIATIVPDMDLVAKVNVPSKLSAPIEINAEAQLDIDAYPSSDYGFVDAFVLSISPMSSSSNEGQQKNYQAILELNFPEEESEISIKDLRPGMGLNARVKLREKPLISTVFTFFEELFVPLSENR